MAVTTRYSRFSWLFLLSCMLLAQACTRDGASVTQDRTDIYGQWQWDHSIGGIFGARVDPKQDSLVLLTITSDLHFSCQVNGRTVKNGVFKLSTTPPRLIDFGVPFFAGGLLISSGVVMPELKNGRLILYDYHVGDGFTHEFK
jgi:hypothetical protein